MPVYSGEWLMDGERYVRGYVGEVAGMQSFGPTIKVTLAVLQEMESDAPDDERIEYDSDDTAWHVFDGGASRAFLGPLDTDEDEPFLYTAPGWVWTEVKPEDCDVVVGGNDPWAEDPDHPVKDWQYEVANNDTRLGYVEWCQHQREAGES